MALKKLIKIVMATISNLGQIGSTNQFSYPGKTSKYLITKIGFFKQ